MIQEGKGNAAIFEISHRVLGKVSVAPAGVIGLLPGYLLRFEIFCPDGKELGLNAEYDVLCYQYYIPAGVCLLQAFADHENPVIRFIFRQVPGKGDIYAVCFHPHGATILDGHSFEQVAPLPEAVQKGDGLPGIGSLFAFRLLQTIQFFHHHQGNDHLILLERVESVGGLHQYIRIYHIGLFHGDAPSLPGFILFTKESIDPVFMIP